MRKFKFHFIIPLLIFWSVARALPSPQGYVNDYASVLKPETKTQIEQLAAQLQQTTGIELAVVTVPTLEGSTVEDYSVKLFGAWGIGQKQKDNGLLFLIAPAERKAHIEVGYGLEGTLNDAKAARLLRDFLVPRAKEGNLDEGIKETSAALFKTFTTGAVPERRQPEKKSFSFFGLLFFLVILYLWIRHPLLFLLFLGGGPSSRGGFGGFGGGGSGGGFGGFGGGSSGGGGGSAGW